MSVNRKNQGLSLLWKTVGSIEILIFLAPERPVLPTVRLRIILAMGACCGAHHLAGACGDGSRGCAS